MRRVANFVTAIINVTRHTSGHVWQMIFCNFQRERSDREDVEYGIKHILSFTFAYLIEGVYLASHNNKGILHCKNNEIVHSPIRHISYNRTQKKIHTYDRRESSYPETRDKPSSLIDKVRVDNRIHIHIVS